MLYNDKDSLKILLFVLFFNIVILYKNRKNLKERKDIKYGNDNDAKNSCSTCRA